MSTSSESSATSSSAQARKIVFVNRYFHPDQSATSQLLTDLATELARLGFIVHVICSRQCYEDPQARLVPRESIAGVTVHRVWTSRFGRSHLLGRAFDYATFYGSSLFRLIHLLKRDDTVVAKTDPPLISILSMMAAGLKGARLINWLQDIFPEIASALGANPLPRSLDVLVRHLRDWSLRRAAANIVLGERMRDTLRRTGVPPERIQVIENWAELRPAKPRPTAASLLRSELELGDRFVVGYSGNLGRAHEFQTLLGAAELLQSDRQIVFLMIGGGIGMTQLACEVALRGLENFRFLHYQPRASLADCLAAVDVHWVSLRPALEGLIVPSKFYGILAAGRPVVFIGDPDGELAREIRRSGCGAAVSVGASRELARVLTDWKSDPAQRERMGKIGYRGYCERYSAERALVQWAQILKPPSRVDDALPRVLSSR